MIILRRILSCAFVLLGASASIAENSPAMSAPPAPEVVVRIDASKTFTPISPYIYGQFLEHIGGLVYGSLWSEVLDDRKFYYPVMAVPAEPAVAEKIPGFSRRKLKAGRWNPVGPVESVTMDKDAPFVGEHSPSIHLAPGELRGIRQDGVAVTAGEQYRGYVYLRGDASAHVVVSLSGADEKQTNQNTVRLSALEKQFTKYTFAFTPTMTGKARFQIAGDGEGTFSVGVVSLMPTNNLFGFRPEAVATLKSLHSGVYRFPGGNFVSAHEWRDAIGDPDKRPPVLDPVWEAAQMNDIGTDEFLKLCELLGVEPYITVNAGTGDAWSAAEYVEYTNGSAESPMGKLRAANGHAAPYHVKFWGIGNEMWGDYQYGYIKLSQYVFKHNQFAKAMRHVDPSITLIASGAMPDTMTGSKQALVAGHDLVPAYLSPGDWTGALLEHCFDNFDLISEHFYNFGTTHFDLARAEQVANDPHEPITDWMRRGANHVRIKYEEYEAYKKLIPALSEHPKPINLDEWAYTPGPHPSYPAYAWIFHELFRHSDLFQMAAHTFATALLSSNKSAGGLNANGLVFKLYREHFGTIPVLVSGNSPQPKPTEPPGGEQPIVNAGSDTFPLDVVAAWSADRRQLIVAVLNPTDVEQHANIEISGAKLTAVGEKWSLASSNQNGADPVITESKLNGPLSSVSTAPYSISIYQYSAD